MFVSYKELDWVKREGISVLWISISTKINNLFLKGHHSLPCPQLFEMSILPISE